MEVVKRYLLALLCVGLLSQGAVVSAGNDEEMEFPVIVAQEEVAVPKSMLCENCGIYTTDSEVRVSALSSAERTALTQRIIALLSVGGASDDSSSK